MNESQKRSFEQDYMPYIIKWGKITCWVSIPLILLPTLALMIVYGAKISFASFITALIPLLGSMLAWYIVDPISLFPVLQVPGLYMTYIAGNSKEIRAPAAIAAMSAADVEPGTDHGTVISCLAIATSVFVSVACMTLVAVAGNFILSVLPQAVITALNFLLPALYGSMCMQRALMDLKTFAVMDHDFLRGAQPDGRVRISSTGRRLCADSDPGGLRLAGGQGNPQPGDIRFGRKSIGGTYGI